MKSKQHRSILLEGSFTVRLPVDRVFPLFSPDGERTWVDGWDPEVMHPEDRTWAAGQVFRTIDRDREVIWVVTHHDSKTHSVTYHRVEGSDLVARVGVSCTGREETQVRVSYSYFGLSAAGDDEIAAMSEAAFAEKMTNWRTQIEEKVVTNA